MYTVEIKTNHDWQVRTKTTRRGVWTSVSSLKFASKKQAEEEVAHLMSNFEDFSDILSKRGNVLDPSAERIKNRAKREKQQPEVDFKVNYRIKNNRDVEWENNKVYNRK